ncbi:MULTISPECIES: hypothetical protein [unclassified Bacillus (in: firmicutes)]|uniref:hypothetical protein n=1 Tax=unclassified Bacillus (in: firmicutes) TaxID=185979 RepID=UPI0008F10AA3|nr:MULTISPECIES: hypothetical protein [unclassified Bacillus (in: firmicutes)]SFK05333.1 hypothetical protein SAMN04488574_14722 [Bacillus sp. 71mf]SFT22579.1 hypothetical protein SAMN04488145_1258 [Bacillus sp. 103mf]
MTLLEMYTEAKKENVVSAWMLIEFLVFEKKALTFTDDVSKLDYYYEPRFRNKMNEYLNEYMKQRGIRAAA